MAGVMIVIIALACIAAIVYVVHILNDGGGGHGSGAPSGGCPGLRKCRPEQVCIKPGTTTVLPPTKDAQGNTCCTLEQVCYDYKVGYCSALGPGCEAASGTLGPFISGLCYPSAQDGPCGMIWQANEVKLVHQDCGPTYTTIVKEVPYSGKTKWQKTPLKSFTITKAWVAFTGSAPPAGTRYPADDLYSLSFAAFGGAPCDYSANIVRTGQNKPDPNTVYCMWFPVYDPDVTHLSPWFDSFPFLRCLVSPSGTDVQWALIGNWGDDPGYSILDTHDKCETAWWMQPDGSAIKGNAVCFRITFMDDLVAGTAVDPDPPRLECSTKWTVEVLARDVQATFPFASQPPPSS